MKGLTLSLSDVKNDGDDVNEKERVVRRVLKAD